MTVSRTASAVLFSLSVSVPAEPSFSFLRLVGSVSQADLLFQVTDVKVLNDNDNKHNKKQ